MQRERLGPRGVLSALSSFETDTNCGFECTYRAHLSKPGVRCGQWALQDSVAGRVGEMIEITDFRKERRDCHFHRRRQRYIGPRNCQGLLAFLRPAARLGERQLLLLRPSRPPAKILQEAGCVVFLASRRKNWPF